MIAPDRFDCNGMAVYDCAWPPPAALKPKSCPSCGEEDLVIYWGTYGRLVAYAEGEWHRPGSITVTCREVRVQRIMCKGCHKTHALLWYGISPYRRYTVRALFLACVVLKKYPPASRAAAWLGASETTCYRAWKDAKALAEALERAIEGLPDALEEASHDAVTVEAECALVTSRFNQAPFSHVPYEPRRPADTNTRGPTEVAGVL